MGASYKVFTASEGDLMLGAKISVFVFLKTSAISWTKAKPSPNNLVGRFP